MNVLAAVMILLVADVELTISVNSSTIRQRDPLLAKAVLRNGTNGPLILAGKGLHSRNIRFEQRVDDDWVSLFKVSGGDFIDPAPGGDPGVSVAENATYAEYYAILFDPKGRFVFDRPGQYEFRAVARTLDGEVVSQPIAVIVEARPADQLLRIEGARRSIGKVGGDQLSKRVATKKDPHPKEIPDELIALSDIGGNISKGVKQLLLVQQIIAGSERVDEPIFDFLKKRMDGVDLEFALLRLGHHYRRWGHLSQLADVLEGLPDMSPTSFEWQRTIDLRTPPSFVPSRGSDE